MKLARNIDQRGRTTRIIAGTVVDLCGAAVLVAGVMRDERWFYVAGVLLSAAGTFMIFEGASGWCAARAMGFKTKL